MNGYSAALQATALASLLLAWSAPAGACSRTPTGLWEVSGTVPVDGSVVLTYGCESPETCSVDDLPALIVRDSSLGNAEVLGSTVRKELVKFPGGARRWALWRPNAPFIAGHSYTLQEQQGSSGSRTFTVVERDTFDPKSIGPRLALDVLEYGSGPLVCCPVKPGSISCDDVTQNCFHAERAQQVMMSVVPFRLTQPLEQWVYRSTYRVGDQSTTFAESPVQWPFWYADTLANEYCYTLDAVHVVTGQVVNLGAECKQATVSQLSRRPATREELDMDLALCASPPAGYETSWQASADRQGRHADAGEPALPDPIQPNERSSFDDQGGCSLGNSPSGRQSLCASLVLLALTGRRRRRS